MTRPSDFILNSDYLSIAQTNRGSFTITIPPGNLQPAGQTGDTVDLTFSYKYPASTGSIDRFMVKVDDWKYEAAFYIVITFGENEEAIGYISLYRANPTTIKARYFVGNRSQSIITYQSFPIKIKITSFHSPNVL